MRAGSVKIRESFNYEVNHRVRIRIINITLITIGALVYLTFL